MPIDLEAAEIEQMSWSQTMQLRWYRPQGGNDYDMRLEQLWERITGERQWRPIQTVLED